MRGWSFSRELSIIFSEEALNLRYHRPRLAGLREISVASHLHRLLASRREGVCGQRDDRDLSRLRIVLQDLRCFPTIDHRDRDVHENQIRMLASRLRNAFFSVQRLGYRVAEMA